jgi:endonuclease/exonuclease/phosphatase family metal-dependent hydrolase
MSAWRILTWNLLGSRGVLVEPVATAILERNPDAVAVQEIQRRQARQLARRLGWHHTWALKHFPYSPAVWWRAEGMAILSRHELDDTVRVRISEGFWTWDYRRRILMGVTVRRDGDELRLFNTHLGGSASERLPQVRRIAVRLRGRATPPASTDALPRPTVLAGDLNAANEPATLTPLLMLGWKDPGGTNSSPADNPYQRIDYVLVPDSATVTDRETPSGGERWKQLSDHLPVLVEFTVAPMS